MKRYINTLLTPIIFLMIALIIGGSFYEIFEACSGRISRFSLEAAETFGLIEDKSPTNLYFWELDYFRINVHASFLLILVSVCLFFSVICKFKRFDRAFVIVILLSIVIVINTPYMIYNLLFFIYGPYIISFILWLHSLSTIFICSILITYLVKHYRNYRNYTLELKALFTSVGSHQILGYFSHNEYYGIIKYSNEDKPLFEKVNGEFVIYVTSHTIVEFEEEFIKKLGYWSYYIDKVESRLKNKELDYHANALNYSEELLENIIKEKKGKHEK